MVGPAAVLSMAGPATLWFKVVGALLAMRGGPGPVRTGACLRARNGLGWLVRRLVKDVACKASGVQGRRALPRFFPRLGLLASGLGG